jgi:hypothetical protein
LLLLACRQEVPVSAFFFHRSSQQQPVCFISGKAAKEQRCKVFPCALFTLSAGSAGLRLCVKNYLNSFLSLTRRSIKKILL